MKIVSFIVCGIGVQTFVQRKTGSRFFISMQEENPHIGKLIQEYVSKKGIKVSWFAEQLSCHRNNIYKIYSRRWIDTETLMRISRVLDHDFFGDLSSYYEKK